MIDTTRSDAPASLTPSRSQPGDSDRLIRLVRRLGWVLLVVFVLAVALNLLPLNLGSPDWGIGVANLIVGSAGLALVGVGLLRMAAFLELQAFANHPANAPGSRLVRLKKAERFIRRLALVGTVSLLLLASWQAILFGQGFELIRAKGDSASGQSEQQIRAVKSRINSAPDQIIESEWQKFQQALPSTLPSTLLQPDRDPASKRKELAASVDARSQQLRVALNRQVSAAGWNLGRNTLRICLMALVFAWGFYGLYKL